MDSSLGTGTASINHLSNAAYELIPQCAVRQSIGGIATGIGTQYESDFGIAIEHDVERAVNLHSLGGQNMAVILGTYQPNVQCRGPFSAWSFCRSVLGDMPVLTIPEISGPPEDHTVQIPLPQKVESSSSALCLALS